MLLDCGATRFEDIARLCSHKPPVREKRAGLAWSVQSAVVASDGPLHGNFKNATPGSRGNLVSLTVCSAGEAESLAIR